MSGENPAFGRHDQEWSVEAVPCPSCGPLASSDTVYSACSDVLHWRPGTFSIVRCRTCQLVRTSPRPVLSILGDYYPSQYYEHAAQEPCHRNEAARAAKAFMRAPYHHRYGSSDDLDAPGGPGQRLLDIGCGTGARLARAAAMGWEAWGVEPSPTAVEQARARRGVVAERIKMGDLQDAELPLGAFDMVTLSHVLEHVPDPHAVVDRVHSLLRPQGVLRVWVPNFASFERQAFGRAWLGLDIPRHLFHFTPATMNELLRRHGFAVERLVPHFQASSLAGSVQLAMRRIRHARSDYRHSSRIYYLSLPPAALLCAAGISGVMDVTARRIDSCGRSNG